MKIIIKPSNLFDKILLNFRCKEGTVSEGSYACEATDLKSKKKYDKEYKEKVTPLVLKLTEKLASMNARQAELHKFFTTPPNGMTYSLHYNTPQFKAWKESPEVKAAKEEYNGLTKPIMDAEKDLAYLNYKRPLVTPEFKKFYDSSYNILKNSSDKELDALSNYMNYGSKTTNKIARTLFPNGEPSPDIPLLTYNSRYGYSEQHFFKFDNLINKSRTPNELILFSGISSSVYNGSHPELMIPGSEIRYPGFMSTSRSEKIAQKFGSVRMKKGERKHDHANADMPTYMEIHLAAGSRAISIEKFQEDEEPDAEWTATKKDNQQEVILGRNVVHKVRDIQIGEFRGKPVRKIIVDSYSLPIKTQEEYYQEIETKLKNVQPTENILDKAAALTVAKTNAEIFKQIGIDVPRDPTKSPLETNPEMHHEAMMYITKSGIYKEVI